MALGLAPPGVRYAADRVETGRRLGLHFVGLLAGASAVAALVWLAGAGLRALQVSELVTGGAAAVAVAYGLVDLGVLRLPALRSTRQLPRHSLNQLTPGFAFLTSGALLGTGVLTVTPYATFTVVLAFEVLSPSPLQALAIGWSYALGRWVGLLADVVESSRHGAPTSFIPATLRRGAVYRRAIGGTSVVAGLLLLTS